MPIPTNGLAEVTFTMTLSAQVFQSVFFYWDNTNTPISNMAGIAAQFDATVVTPLAANVTSALAFTDVLVRDVLGLNPDFNVAPATVGGVIAGDTLPPFNAVRIDLLVATKETKRGYKRVPGLLESQTTGDSLIAGTQAAFQTYSLTYLTGLVVGINTYGPVIRGGPIPTDLTRSVVNPVTSTNVPILVTSQVSRKS